MRLQKNLKIGEGFLIGVMNKDESAQNAFRNY